MHAAAFIAKWRRMELKERSAVPSHFVDVRRMCRNRSDQSHRVQSFAPPPWSADAAVGQTCRHPSAKKRGGPMKCKALACVLAVMVAAGSSGTRAQEAGELAFASREFRYMPDDTRVTFAAVYFDSPEAAQTYFDFARSKFPTNDPNVEIVSFPRFDGDPTTAVYRKHSNPTPEDSRDWLEIATLGDLIVKTLVVYAQPEQIIETALAMFDLVSVNDASDWTAIGEDPLGFLPQLEELPTGYAIVGEDRRP